MSAATSGKLKSTSGFLAGVLALGSCAGLAEPATNRPLPDPAISTATAPPPVFTATNRQVIEAWGWIIAHNKNVAGIEINETELAAFLRGFLANARGQPAPQDLRKILGDIETLAGARRDKMTRAGERKNEAAAKGYFSGLKKNLNVAELPGGVRYEILKPGNGLPPKPQQTVNVHYTGRLADGTEFIQNGPVDMVLVTNHGICRGWVEALQQVKPGGALKLYVPPPLARTDADQLGIPPGSAMVFEIELLAVKETSAQDLADVLTPLPPRPPSPPPSGLTDVQIIETWGWTVAAETRVARFGLSETELAALVKGLTAGIEDRPASRDWDRILPEVESFVNGHLEKARETFKQKQLADRDKLFAGLKTNTKVVALPDGLRYEILQPGHGPGPKPEQTVKVNYTGRLINGTVFDRTDLGPLDVDLDKVIPGWAEGVQKIGVGGKIRLYLPPELGYRDVPTSGIPPNSTLIFEVELLEIKNAPPRAR